jgi:large subunit ribosomal protein L17
MRHQTKTVKLGRKSEHRDALLSNLVCSLINHNRITTTLAKAKAMKPLAEKMVTLGKKGDLHHRRLAVASIKQQDAVKKLFTEIAPRFKDRKGGYTRVLKLGLRPSDAAPMALIEWVELPATSEEKAPKAKKAVAKK